MTPSEWTHDGDRVLLVRQVGKGGESSYGFVWPLAVGAEVVAPDWEPTKACGHGLHGWPWGLSVGDGREPDYAATWMVVSADPRDVVDLGGKAKCRACRVEYVGRWHEAMARVHAGQTAYIQRASRGAASATGEGGAASATASRGAASATGESGAAVVTGFHGRAQAGVWGCIALAWLNQSKRRNEMRCARVGCGDGSDGMLKSGVWYVLDAAGEFVEEQP